MAELSLEWGESGTKRAIARDDVVVIIDQLRFSSTMVTATAHGFTIEPISEKPKMTEGFKNSPLYFLDKEPRKVMLYSANGAQATLAAKNARHVIYGSILNAKAAAAWIDKTNESTTLVAAGEKDVGYGGTPERHKYMDKEEAELTRVNNLWALEDLLGAGAIAYFSKMKKTKEVIEAQKTFEKSKDNLFETLVKTSSGKWLFDKHGSHDDLIYCNQLNLYKVVPRLHMIDGVPEIRAD